MSITPPKPPPGIPPKCKGKPLRWWWPVPDPTGNVLGYRARYNGTNGSKEFLSYFHREGQIWKGGEPDGPLPLIGLPTLKPGCTVYLPEGERKATALHSLGLPAVSTIGGSGSEPKTDWSPLAVAREIVYMPDNDEAGEKRLQAALEGLAALPDRPCVKVCRLPDLPEKGDVVDFIQRLVPEWDGYTADIPRVPGLDLQDVLLETIEEHKQDAALPEREGPQPLRRQPTPASPYPVEALGDILGSAARVLADVVQAPESMSGNAVLAAASLAAQPHVDVEVDGRQTPVSIYALTVACSGDRKSSLDAPALEPIHTFERRQEAEYKLLYRNFRDDLDVWQGERKRILSSGKLTGTSKRDALDALGPEPTPPPSPVLLLSDVTAEGVRNHLLRHLPSCGIFSDEGSRVLAGHSLNGRSDTRLAAAGLFTNLWGGTATQSARAGDGGGKLRGKRLSMHLMVQPNIAPLLLSDPDFCAQGFVWRFLLAWPDSLMGLRDPRRRGNVYDAVEYQTYADRILELLETPWPITDGELHPRVLTLDPAALEVYLELGSEVEHGLRDRLRSVSGFAARTGEHALRIAGVLAVVGDPDVQVIGAATMQDGCTLARWYLQEMLRLQEAGTTDPAILEAEKLLEWFKERGEARTVEVYQSGPAELRSKDSATPVLRILEDHGWIKRTCERPETWTLTSKQ